MVELEEKPISYFATGTLVPFLLLSYLHWQPCSCINRSFFFQGVESDWCSCFGLQFYPKCFITLSFDLEPTLKMETEMLTSFSRMWAQPCNWKLRMHADGWCDHSMPMPVTSSQSWWCCHKMQNPPHILIYAFRIRVVKKEETHHQYNYSMCVCQQECVWARYI